MGERVEVDAEAGEGGVSAVVAVMGLHCGFESGRVEMNRIYREVESSLKEVVL